MKSTVVWPFTRMTIWFAVPGHFLRKPRIDGDQDLLDGHRGPAVNVETARFGLVAAAVDLGFVTVAADFGAELLAEELAAVAAGVDLGLDAEMEVLIVAPLGVQMAHLRAAADEDAVLHTPVARRDGVC